MIRRTSLPARRRFLRGSEGSERRLASAPPLWWISPTESKGRTENPSRSDGVPALHTFLAIARKTCSSAACCRQWTPPRGAAPLGCEGHRSRGRQFFLIWMISTDRFRSDCPGHGSDTRSALLNEPERHSLSRELRSPTGGLSPPRYYTTMELYRLSPTCVYRRLEGRDFMATDTFKNSALANFIAYLRCALDLRPRCESGMCVTCSPQITRSGGRKTFWAQKRSAP